MDSQPQTVATTTTSSTQLPVASESDAAGGDFIPLERGHAQASGKVKVTLENGITATQSKDGEKGKAEARAKAKARARDSEARLFVGGLPPDAEDEDLREHFVKFGKVTEASVIRERDTGRSRNFGFVTLQDLTESSKETVLTSEHELKRKKVSVKLHERDGNERDRSPKRRKQKQERSAPAVSDIHKKAFVDGLSLRTTAEALRRACSRFGAISDVTVLKDDDDKPTGKGEVLFATMAAARVALQEGAVDVDGRRVAVRPPSGAGSEGVPQAAVYGGPPSYGYYAVQAPGYATYPPAGVTYVYSSASPGAVVAGSSEYGPPPAHAYAYPSPPPGTTVYAGYSHAPPSHGGDPGGKPY